MSNPYHEIPEPKPSAAGRNNRVIADSVRRIASLWRPKGAKEPNISTIARFAHRVMDSEGNAYTADALGSGTTETILDKLKGTEADPDRIGVEYLPEVIEGTFELADATGTVIADQQIAAVNGHPSYGDGETLEGNIMGSRIKRVSGSKSAVDLQSNVLQKLLSLPVSGESLANQRSLYFDVSAILEFSSNSFPQAPIIVAALTDYTGFVEFTTSTEINNLGVQIAFGAFPVADSVFQVVGPAACNIAFVAANPPFITLDKYRLRQRDLTYQGATLNKIAAGSSQALPIVNLGGGSVATASKCPSTAEDCMLSFYLVIPASAGETRTLKYSLTVKADF
jgi:hypothetical protein